MLPHSATAKKIWRSRSLMRLPIRPSQLIALAIKDRLLGQKQNDYSIYITAAYVSIVRLRRIVVGKPEHRYGLQAALILARDHVRRVLAATMSAGWMRERAW